MASATITDVARLAGVSMKTVSRVMNAEAHVREAVRERVLSAARELHYRPRVSARSLAGARSYAIGYLLVRSINPYAGQTQLGALRACREAGYHLVVEITGEPEGGFDLETLLASASMDGMLLIPPLCDDTDVLDALDRAGMPYVRIAPATDPGRSPYVDVEDQAAAAQMTAHLVALGHRRIGFVMGPEGHAASRRRLDGFRETLRTHGLPADDALVRPGDFAFDSGAQAAAELLTLSEPPTAIFASNDVMALGVMAKARELGLRLPEDLSIAGFDDIPAADMVWPGLTTVAQPIVQMATEATRTLIALTRRAPTEPARRLSCELVIRGSTAPPGG